MILIDRNQSRQGLCGNHRIVVFEGQIDDARILHRPYLEILFKANNSLLLEHLLTLQKLFSIKGCLRFPFDEALDR